MGLKKKYTETLQNIFLALILEISTPVLQMNRIHNSHFPIEDSNSNTIESALLQHSEQLQRQSLTGTPIPPPPPKLTIHIVNLWRDVHISTV